MLNRDSREFIKKALTDRQFRRQLLAEPEVVLSSYDLTEDKIASIISSPISSEHLAQLLPWDESLDFDLSELVVGEPIEPSKWYDTLHQSNEENPGVIKMRGAFARNVSHIGQFSWITTAELDLLIQRARIGENSTILDVCCGCGGPTLYVAWMTGCHATGLDFSDRAISYSIEKATSLRLNNQTRFVCADALDMPFPSESFDVIISFGAFVNIFERQRLLDQCHRVLKPGGVIAFYDQISYEDFGEGTAIPPDIFELLEVFVPHYLLTIPTYSRLLDNAGFKNIQIEDRTEGFMRVNRAWISAFLEVWDDLFKEHGSARFLAERQYLETLEELAKTRKASEAFCVAYKLSS